jgi:hypothetical protein
MKAFWGRGVGCIAPLILNIGARCRWVKSDRLARIVIFLFWPNSPQWARASSFTRFLDHTKRRTTVGKTPLGEWSARRRDLYMTTHNTHMPPVGFEPTISAGERRHTYALDRATTRIGINPFRSYVEPRPIMWFSCFAPMSEGVRHDFCCVCSPAVGACPTLFLV